MLNKKKKGFTLIELIAVIAILGVLASVIVPKVGNFTDKAKTSAKRADAKSVLVLVEAYNAEAATTQKITGATTFKIITDGTGLDTGVTIYNDLKDTVARVTAKTNAIYSETTTISTIETDGK